jgi:hypothetical protein
MGLVDGVADPNALYHAALQAAQGLADGTLRPKRGPQGMVSARFSRSQPGLVDAVSLAFAYSSG